MAQNRPGNLYCLIAGINDYARFPLLGSVNDAKSWSKYIDNETVRAQFQDVHKLELFERDATKNRIVEGFRDHLGRAGENDVAVFYFAGHGAREKTDVAMFRQGEIDDNIGGICCAGFESPKQQCLHKYILSNKELRHLVRALAVDEDNRVKCHVLAIFDCCHSGSNTRAVADQEQRTARQISRNALPGRALNEFIFSQDDVLVQKLAQSGDLDEVMPQGDHVMLAACREVELAWETPPAFRPRGGAFTTALIDVLNRHKGRISYHELYARVLNRMKFSMSETNGDEGQTPQVYVRTRNMNDRYNLFLTNQRNDLPRQGAVEYSNADKEWRIDLGALNGVPVNRKSRSTTVQVFPLNEKSNAVDVPIRSVTPTYSVLDLNAKPKAGTSYRGEIKGLAVRPIKILLNGKAPVFEETGKYLRQQQTATGGQVFELVGEEEDADYVINTGEDRSTITRPFDPRRPVTRTIGHSGDGGAPTKANRELLFTVLQQIGRWHFFKDIEEASTELPPSLVGKTAMYPVEFRLYVLHPDGSERRIVADDNRFILPSANDAVLLRIELINHAPQLLNCSVVYLSGDFGIAFPTSWFVKDKSVFLLNAANDREGKNVLRMRGHPPEGFEPAPEHAYHWFRLDPYYRDFNLPGESVFFKLVVSSKSIDTIETLAMEGLGYPSLEKSTTRGDRDPTAPPPGHKPPEPNLPKVEWDIRTLEIYMPNPAYEPR